MATSRMRNVITADRVWIGEKRFSFLSLSKALDFHFHVVLLLFRSSKESAVHWTNTRHCSSTNVCPVTTLHVEKNKKWNLSAEHWPGWWIVPF